MNPMIIANALFVGLVVAALTWFLYPRFKKVFSNDRFKRNEQLRVELQTLRDQLIAANEKKKELVNQLEEIQRKINSV